jgi:hypothetical protein
LIDVDGGHQNAGIDLLKEGLNHLATSSGETRRNGCLSVYRRFTVW